jgi:hypothetical protein
VKSHFAALHIYFAGVPSCIPRQRCGSLCVQIHFAREQTTSQRAWARLHAMKTHLFELMSSLLGCEIAFLTVISSVHAREPSLLACELPLYAREPAPRLDQGHRDDPSRPSVAREPIVVAKAVPRDRTGVAVDRSVRLAHRIQPAQFGRLRACARSQTLPDCKLVTEETRRSESKMKPAALLSD